MDTRIQVGGEPTIGAPPVVHAVRRLTRGIWGFSVVLALFLAACNDQEGPVAAETGPDRVVAEANAAAAPTPVRFGTPQQWSSSFCRKGEVCLLADVDGDRKADAIAFNHGVNSTNAVYVIRSNGTSFGTPEKWSSLFCRSTETCAVGDVNYDNRADLIAFTRGTAKDVWVALSNGSRFGAPQKWSDFFCRTGEVCKVADVNYDAKADLVAFQHGVNGANGVFVGLSNGSSFGPPQRWSNHFCLSTETCEVAGVAGGQKAIIAFTRDPNNEVYVGLGSVAGFLPPTMWSLFFCRTGEVCLSGDFNADRAFDVIAFNHGLGGANAVYVATRTGSSFTPTAKASDYFCTLGQTCAVGDMTGDGKADVVAFTRGTNPRVFVGVSQ